MSRADALPLGTERPRREPNRWVALLAGLALFISACMGLWLAGRDPGVPRQKLPDGTWLELRDYEFGIDPELDERRGWQRWLPGNVSLQPAGLGQLPLVITRKYWINSKAPGRYSGGPTLNYLVAQTKGVPLTRYAAVFGVLQDEHGCWFEPRITDYGHSPDTMMLYWLQFNPPPADSRQLQLCFVDSYGGKAQAVFSVRRPLDFGLETTIGKPLGLPITVSNGGLDFTLTSLNHRQAGLRRRESARFRVSRRGQDVAGWRPVSVKVTDASGALADSSVPLAGGEIRFSGLCRRSPAWRLEVDFVRVEDRLEVERRQAVFVVKP